MIHKCQNREKEEDLEKRQFFINRELRSLTSLSGIWNCCICDIAPQKTKRQKDRKREKRN